MKVVRRTTCFEMYIIIVNIYMQYSIITSISMNNIYVGKTITSCIHYSNKKMNEFIYIYKKKS